jgi:hypothetical protein|tara:strand:- start:667 stop:843 length:177 start_codon:yes stop_codon:yes gene_type:complete
MQKVYLILSVMSVLAGLSGSVFRAAETSVFDPEQTLTRSFDRFLARNNLVFIESPDRK